MPRKLESREARGWGRLAFSRSAQRRERALKPQTRRRLLLPALVPIRRATARHNLGLIYRGLGRRSEALAHWRAALTEAPDLAEARRCLEETRSA